MDPDAAPVRLDTVDVTAATDFNALMHGALEGTVGGSLRSDCAPLDWVLRVYRQVEGTPVAERISRAVAANLTAPEPAVRALALIFFESYPRVPGSERIVDLVAGDRALFAGITDPYSSENLEGTLVRVLGCRLRRGDTREIELARDEALRPGQTTSIVRSLIEVDDEWVAEHAEQIVRRTPAAGLLVLAGLHDEGFDILALVARLAPLCRDTAPVEDLYRMIDDPPVRAAIRAAFRR